MSAPFAADALLPIATANQRILFEVLARQEEILARLDSIERDLPGKATYTLPEAAHALGISESKCRRDRKALPEPVAHGPLRYDASEIRAMARRKTIKELEAHYGLPLREVG